MSSNLPKINKFSVRISAPASKKRPNQKNKSTLYHQLDDFILTLLHFFFDLTSFLRGWGRNPYRKFVGFWGDLKTPKGHFDINWPLKVPRPPSDDDKELYSIIARDVFTNGGSSEEDSKAITLANVIGLVRPLF